MDHVRHQLIVLVLAAATYFSAACGRQAEGGEAVPRGTPVVDSAVPREVALERFREGLVGPTGLVSAASDRDALVRAFVRAVENSDTAALGRLTLDRAEFAWLYYPTTPQGLPPYDLSPGLMWFLIEGGHQKGLRHLLEEYGGRPLGYTGYACDPTPSREGANTVWGPCVVRREQTPGDTVEARMFGLIIERDGRFKFVSLANKL